MPSKPAATALVAACANSATAAVMSASVIASGTGSGFMPSASVYISPAAAIADGASTRAPAGRLSACETRPVCISCTKILPPRAWTASVTRRQPAICSSEKMPGMRA